MRRILAVLALVLLCAVPAAAQAAVENSSQQFVSGGSISFSYTVSGSNRVLYVIFTHANGGTDVTGIACTYNGVALTAISTDTTQGTRQQRTMRLIAPATGANTLACTGGTGGLYNVIVASVTGADQTTPEDALQVQDGSGGGTSSSVTVSSAANNLVLGFTVAANGIAGPTAGTGETLVQSGVGGGGGEAGMFLVREAGGASVTIAPSWTGFTAYRAWAFDINAAAAGAATNCTGALLGVGCD